MNATELYVIVNDEMVAIKKYIEAYDVCCDMSIKLGGRLETSSIVAHVFDHNDDGTVTEISTVRVSLGMTHVEIVHCLYCAYYHARAYREAHPVVELEEA